MTKVNYGTEFPKDAHALLGERDFHALLRERTETLNEAVNRSLIMHIPRDSTLRMYLSATTDAESQTGKRSVDNAFAAKRLIELCENNPVISREKLVTVQRAMNVVLRRYGLSFSQRKQNARIDDEEHSRPETPV